ncbi:MAG: hypothetical protein JSU97_05855 [Dehalococcoidia bacterium]|nr:MAG: hypothetical protein JSU97_05855 [Dehalococcoidia bacterium]
MLRRLLLAKAREEQGQGLVVATLAMVVILAFAAMAIDVGLFLHERRELQKAADAAALAGAAELPGSPADAMQKAHEWAANNGIDGGEFGSVEIVTTYVPNDSITVRLQRDVPFAFARVLGFTSDTMSADATARIGSPAGMSGLVPWATEEASVQQAIETGEAVTLEFGAPGMGEGNFGGIVLDQPGGDEYEENIKYGAEQMICSVNQIPIPGCDTAVKPQTGNQAQIMAQSEGAVVWRMDNTSGTCAVFDNVFASTGDGTYEINAGCNPFAAGVESCDEVQSCLIVPIVVIDEFPEGSSEFMPVLEFALFFLEQFDPGSCNPASCQVEGRFVNAKVSLPALLGSYDPEGSFHFVRLIE